MTLAETDPVAEVVVDSPLPHLDRRFDYAVPASLAGTATPGVRVKVPFAGRDLGGFVVRRKAQAEHPGSLALLRSVVSPEPVLTPHLLRVCREVADTYAGSLADVLRLAIPPRHARAERLLDSEVEPSTPAWASGPVDQGWAQAWSHYPAGPALLRRLAAGEAPAAAWTALPDAGASTGWPTALAAAAAATLASGRSALVVVPDHRDVDRLVGVIEQADLPHGDAVVRLTADLGPQQRYRAWLLALRGRARVVVGTRAAAFAPLPDLGLVAWWDDGDDLHQEPRAPYPHVRQVLRARARDAGAGLLVGGFGRTVQVQHWVEGGELVAVEPRAGALRERTPRVVVAGEGHEPGRDPAAEAARIPSLAWRAAKEGLLTGPVLVQVPRRGYRAGLSCARCHTPVRCATCGGPVSLDGPDAEPACSWCSAGATGRPCPECGEERRRSTVVGARRTAEELGRAFAGVPVRTSGGESVVSRVGSEPALVVATPGAEPVAATGYAVVLLLDGWALLDRAGLDSPIEACRRWLSASALCRPADAGGRVVVCGVPAHGGVAPVEALVRWSPVQLASRELAERTALGLPPGGHLVLLEGDSGAVHDAADHLDALPGATILGRQARNVGPRAPGAPTMEQAVVLSTDVAASAVRAALVAVRATRSLRKTPGDLRVVVDAAW